MSDDRFFGYKHWTLEAFPRCFYVGKGLKRRITRKDRNHKWHAIVKRYGLRIEICVGPISNKDVCCWEIEWIAKENTYSNNHSHVDSNDIGCNLTKGGEGTVGYKHSTAYKEAARARELGKAKNFSQEALQRIREVATNPSLETRQRLSEARKRRSSPSLETRKKMSDAAQQSHNKCIARCDLTDQILEIFLSVKAAAQSLGKHHGNIASAARGNLRSAYGFHWRYL